MIDVNGNPCRTNQLLTLLGTASHFLGYPLTHRSFEFSWCRWHDVHKKRPNNSSKNAVLVYPCLNFVYRIFFVNCFLSIQFFNCLPVPLTFCLSSDESSKNFAKHLTGLTEIGGIISSHTLNLSPVSFPFSVQGSQTLLARYYYRPNYLHPLLIFTTSPSSPWLLRTKCTYNWNGVFWSRLRFY